ncbi:peroxiredoxin [Pseudomonas sp. Q2-TVG4-2]|uniref:peroxiredoxin family protein n=1 Tax=Pseudomonas sp. Q2-TVG4-2 TaxID=1685699 RepID=UPI0015E7AF41|nr:TlpA disulfide reductase family protein [Pseudomonas sp. Q2-TVG4-2]
MQTTDQTQQPQVQQPPSVYNYDRFHPSTLGKDVKLVMSSPGPMPGDLAPDFTVQDIDGKTWRLNELRGQPVVLIFGSGTCPMTTGSLPGLTALHRERGQDGVQWLMFYVREAHPGEEMPAHHSMEQKRQQARRLRDEDGVEWPILVGELDGATHRQYTELPNHLLLIDTEGRVAFRSEFAHAPTLWRALQQLEVNGWVGPVDQGVDKTMHMVGPTAYGWGGPSRGGKIAINDLVKGAPPLAANLWLGQFMRPMLAPIAERSRPLPPAAKLGLALAAVGLAALAIRMLKRDPE